MGFSFSGIQDYGSSLHDYGRVYNKGFLRSAFLAVTPGICAGAAILCGAPAVPVALGAFAVGVGALIVSSRITIANSGAIGAFSTSAMAGLSGTDPNGGPIAIIAMLSNVLAFMCVDEYWRCYPMNPRKIFWGGIAGTTLSAAMVLAAASYGGHEPDKAVSPTAPTLSPPAAVMK